MATKKATPWGKAVLLDEVVVPQRAPGPRSFTTHVQLLETDSGERLVRLAYATTAHGWVRRGPVTMRIDDLVALSGLEAFPIDPATGIDWSSDPVNPTPPRRGVRPPLPQ